MTQLHVGRFAFVLVPDRSVPIRETDTHYDEFIGEGRACAASDMVTVTIRTEGRVEIPGGRRIFDAGGAWQAFADGDTREFAFFRTGAEQPYLTARCELESALVDVHSPELLTVADDGTEFIRNPLRYPLDQILVMYFGAARGDVIVHACGVSARGRGLLFPGRSGAGKSTLARSLRDRKEIELLSDDRIVVAAEEDQTVLWGTPWPGEAGVARNAAAPCNGVFLLTHAGADRIRDASESEMLSLLVPACSVPWFDEPVQEQVLAGVGRLITGSRHGVLEFAPGTGVGDLIVAAAGG